MQKNIPKTFSKYFWDTRIENLAIDKNHAYIIERLLELGDIKELDWVTTNYARDQILTTIKNSRRISPKTGNFFSLYYDIPKESLACMKKRFI